MEDALVPGEFYDATLGRDRSAQDREAAFFLDGLRESVDHFLAGGFFGRLQFLEESFAGGGDAIGQQAGVFQVFPEQAHAAGAVHVRRDEAAAGLEIGEDGSLRENFVEFFERERNACVARDGEQVKHGVCGTAGGRHRRNRILQRRRA